MMRLIPGLGPISVIAAYFVGALIGGIAAAKGAQLTAKSFFRRLSRGTQKTSSSSPRGRLSE
jgi:hypothetical protein